VLSHCSVAGLSLAAARCGAFLKVFIYSQLRHQNSRGPLFLGRCVLVPFEEQEGAHCDKGGPTVVTVEKPEGGGGSSLGAGPAWASTEAVV
jgi:hypothetical protein